MNKYLDQQLEERFTSWTIAKRESGTKQKYIMDLALDTYMEQREDRESSKRTEGLDSVFKRSAIDRYVHQSSHSRRSNCC